MCSVACKLKERQACREHTDIQKHGTQSPRNLSRPSSSAIATRFIDEDPDVSTIGIHLDLANDEFKRKDATLTRFVSDPQPGFKLRRRV
jgi:hypothetical protein